MPRSLAARRDWNVVVTVYEEGWKPAKRILGQVGAISATDYYDVLVMKVEDPAAFMRWLTERVAREPGLCNLISRVVPAGQAFDFHSAEEFEAKAREAVLDLMPRLAGKSFHVRMYRRGFKRRLSAHEEERRLGAVLFDALQAAGTPARIEFDDPDATVVIETVGERAGVSLFTREDREGCPFLHLD
jgi:tRNA(Ser,Leu) C12 N-acetylase TAN1